MHQMEEVFEPAREGLRLETEERMNVVVPDERVLNDVPAPRADAGGHQGKIQAFVAFFQCPVLLVDAREHLIEGVGQQTELVVRAFGGPHRIVAPVGDGVGGVASLRIGSETCRWSTVDTMNATSRDATTTAATMPL